LYCHSTVGLSLFGSGASLIGSWGSLSLPVGRCFMGKEGETPLSFQEPGGGTCPTWTPTSLSPAPTSVRFSPPLSKFGFATPAPVRRFVGIPNHPSLLSALELGLMLVAPVLPWRLSRLRGGRRLSVALSATSPV
jgi:hypothetical protein